MGTQTFNDPKVVQLGEKHGPLGLAWWTALLCNAGAQEGGGTVDLSFRAFAFELHSDSKAVAEVLDTATDLGLCHTLSRDVHGFKVEIPGWKRWQDAGRQARSRARRKAHENADVTDMSHDGHGPSRDVTTDRQTDRQDSNSAREQHPKVFAALEAVAFSRNLTSPPVGAVLEVCEQYSHLDLDSQAARFRHYWIDGPGKANPLPDVAWALRNWLERVREDEAPRVTKAPGKNRKDYSQYDAVMEPAQ
jgi:hypothetical protein